MKNLMDKSDMNHLSKKKHRHEYSKVMEWISEPKSHDEIQRYWCFDVIRACECGITKRGHSELHEVEEFIKNATCIGCGSITFKNKHKTQTDCIHDLNNRVRFLEERLEKVCDALSGIGR
jgi:hypothetical protein